MIIKSVATAFLTYRGKILILKRSDKVGTYRGAWAGVSGYVEQGEEPLDTALKEVVEETGLKLDRGALLKRGAPLPAYDKVKDVLWLVHPFLFKAPTNKIRLDWEHETYAWIKPEAVKHYSTVPRLADALERVKPPAFKLDKTLSSYLKEIKQDSTHGSSWLAARAARILQVASDSSTYSSVDQYVQFLKFYAKMLAEARPSMLAIENTIIYLLGALMEGYSKTPDLTTLKDLLRRAVSEWLKIKEVAFKKCVENTSNLFEEECKVITHSYSSTVLEALKQASSKNRGITVYVSESRPRYEGRIMAKKLAESRCDVTLITDASIGHFIKDADVAVVGADTISADGSIINKVGTYLLALSAYKANVPFYVAAETLKIGVRTLFAKPVLEEHSPTEVFKGSPSLKARNIYFDVTPADLVTKIICEDGLIEVSKAYEYAVKALRLSYFP
ncbi:MAG: NUDIX domain-containing protein [Nitrososphaerales archaeon]